MKKQNKIKLILGFALISGIVYSPALASKMNSVEEQRSLQVSQLKPEPVQIKKIHLESDPQIAELPAQKQIEALAQKYTLTINQNKPIDQQQVARFLIQTAAKEYEIPEAIALALSGYESAGWQMWQRTKQLEPQKNINYLANGQIHSTDWGLMQINDQAHPEAFPKAQYDMVFNITYGMKYLANLHTQINGSLNLGLGDWDKTLAAYHLGHEARAEEQAYASKYIRRILDYAIKHQLLTEVSYTVQAGDNLGVIAEKQLGAFSRWPEILTLNPRLKNQPDQVKAGQDLHLPAS